MHSSPCGQLCRIAEGTETDQVLRPLVYKNLGKNIFIRRHSLIVSKPNMNTGAEIRERKGGGAEKGAGGEREAERYRDEEGQVRN